MLEFARLETLSLVAQITLVSRTRLLIGNHGAGTCSIAGNRASSLVMTYYLQCGCSLDYVRLQPPLRTAAGLTWAAMLPSESHCAVLELYADASADGLPVDISHFSATNGVRHRVRNRPGIGRPARRRQAARGMLWRR